MRRVLLALLATLALLAAVYILAPRTHQASWSSTGRVYTPPLHTHTTTNTSSRVASGWERNRYRLRDILFKVEEPCIKGSYRGNGFYCLQDRLDRFYAKVFTNGTLLVTPPGGRGELGRSDRRVPYPLWRLLRVVNATRVAGYIKWLRVIAERLEYGRVPPGFNTVHRLPRTADFAAPFITNYTVVRMGTILLPYGYAVTIVFARIGEMPDVFIHLYQWNSTGLAEELRLALAAGDWRTARRGNVTRGDVLWVVEMPVDPRHAAVIEWNGTLFPVKGVYLLLEEPVYAVEPGDMPLYHFGYWFWTAASIAGAIAEWLSGANYTSLVKLVPYALDIYDASYRRDEAWRSSLPHFFLEHRGGVCQDYMASAIALYSGLFGLPSVELLTTDHGAAGVFKRLDKPCFKEKLLDYWPNWRSPMLLTEKQCYTDEIDVAPEIDHYTPIVVPPGMLHDAVGYWLVWRPLYTLPWWLHSPYANTTVGRASIHWYMVHAPGGFACTPRILREELGDWLAKPLPRGLDTRPTPTGRRVGLVEPVVYRVNVTLDYNWSGPTPTLVVKRAGTPVLTTPGFKLYCAVPPWASRHQR